MDKNENGFPISGAGGAKSQTPRRDCTGSLNDSGGGNNGQGGCGPENKKGVCSDCLDTKPLAYPYIPIQRWQMLYTVDNALGRGTLFEELDKPLGVYGNE